MRRAWCHRAAPSVEGALRATIGRGALNTVSGRRVGEEIKVMDTGSIMHTVEDAGVSKGLSLSHKLAEERRQKGKMLKDEEPGESSKGSPSK